MTGAHGFDLSGDASALKPASHEPAEDRRIVQRPAINEILDMGDEEPASEVLFLVNLAHSFEVVI